jgi:hypothetical protein
MIDNNLDQLIEDINKYEMECFNSQSVIEVLNKRFKETEAALDQFYSQLDNNIENNSVTKYINMRGDYLKQNCDDLFREFKKVLDNKEMINNGRSYEYEYTEIDFKSACGKLNIFVKQINKVKHK